MPLTDSHRVLIEFRRAGRALTPGELAARLAWPPERLAAALHQLAAQMLVGCDESGNYFITLPGRRRLRPRRADREDVDVDVGDDDGEPPTTPA